MGLGPALSDSLSVCGTACPEAEGRWALLQGTLSPLRAGAAKSTVDGARQVAYGSQRS